MPNDEGRMTKQIQNLKFEIRDRTSMLLKRALRKACSLGVQFKRDEGRFLTVSKAWHPVMVALLVAGCGISLPHKAAKVAPVSPLLRNVEEVGADGKLMPLGPE